MQPDYRWNIERTRQNRRMRGAATEIRRDPEHVRLVNACRIRRSEIMRDQNVRLVQSKECFGTFTLKVANYALCNVLDIERALSQVGIIDSIQGLGVSRGDFLENPFHIAKIGLQLPKHFVDQRAVLDYEQVSIEDGSIFRPDRFCNALLHLQNLHARLNKGRFEARDFIRHLGRRNAVTHDLLQFIAGDMDPAAGDSGRDASSFKPNFFWRVLAAHPLGRVRQMSNIANLALQSA